MKIVYLDKPTYMPDSFVREMGKLGAFEIYEDRPDEETAVRRLTEADIAIVEWTRLTADMFARIRRLQYLSLVMTSCDLIDLPAAGAAGIEVSNCPTYSARSVAEHVFALLMAVNRRILHADRTVRQGGSHVYGPFLGKELFGATFGVIGTGRIGQEAARIARGFGMRVIGSNLSGREVPGIERKELEELMRESDVVSVHAPHNDTTRGMLSAELLASMKPSAILINTCRAALVDEEALFSLLRDGRIAGAGLDDVAKVRDNPLYALGNVVFSPGSAWYTREARDANMVELLENIRSYVNGTPKNIVNGKYLSGRRL
ncbi:D-2-hydroxyacid dehydrogenase [Cohnella sp. CFH 77786]|uniref:2-hydroxyacid dehydrogenase n=1 Tax=Cohnella sp. CFH 77786 TaxID=2662265 RepID=UPI001C60AF15|nr:NAD(P)-dependent oxidoreductase [Cohnella sp. CFH 77786]MBW5446406.1 D-2-hydroxyacid dehydrogenase [Cohnella sp. CFH 77786]